MDSVRVGITQGDINGVGYEVIFKAIGEEGITELFTPVVFGVASIAQKAQELCGLQNLKLNIVRKGDQIKEGKVNLVVLEGEEPELHPGEVREDAGRSAAAALEKAVDSLKNGEIDVLVTAPICKEAIQSERFNFPGHTEFLSHRFRDVAGDSDQDAMMILCNDSLRVALLTVHVPITKVSEKVTTENIIRSVEKFSSILKKDFGIVRPTIAVLSLNPHAGDGGLLGTEEEEIIKPAISDLKQNGILAFGPFAADGFFGHGNYKNFDGILAMYHDQGLAPFKTLASKGGVNYSGALPFIRTSPDHGTAFDIAWKGEADASSMRDAIYMAIDIFRRRKIFEEASENPLKKYVHERPERGERQERPSAKSEKETIE